MIRRVLAAGAATAVSALTVGFVARRASDRLLAAPRVLPEEGGLGPALDALGGEVVRLRARDGVRLAARWLPAEGGDPAWPADPHEAILLLHGYSGSIAPDLVEFAPFLRRTASVLGLDFRGHGLSDDGPSTFGLLETEDIGGALAWLGERGITRVALVGSSMGGISAIAAAAVLGDGSIAGADVDPAVPRHVEAAPRPRIVGIVADSIPDRLDVPIAARLRGPGRRLVARTMFDVAGRRLGADPRATEPARVIGLLESLPVLLIHGDADTTVPVESARRLVDVAGSGADQWIVAGAGHAEAHRTAPEAYEARTTSFLRSAFTGARPQPSGGSESRPIIGAPGDPVGPGARSIVVED